MRRLLLTLALALVAAGPTFAKKHAPTAPPEVTAPEEELTAAPGSIGYGMIEQADADGVFELVHDGQVTLRHVGSGLICRFLRNGENGQLLMFPGSRRGDDVGCDSNDGVIFTTFYATRYPRPAALDDLLAGAVGAIYTRFPDAQPFTTSEARTRGMSPRRHAGFIIRRQDGARMYTHVSVTQVGEWIIKLRYTRAAANDREARQDAREASALFEDALRDIIAPPNL